MRILKRPLSGIGVAAFNGSGGKSIARRGEVQGREWDGRRGGYRSSAGNVRVYEERVKIKNMKINANK